MVKLSLSALDHQINTSAGLMPLAIGAMTTGHDCSELGTDSTVISSFCWFSHNDHISQPFSGGIVCYTYLHRVAYSWPRTLILVFIFFNFSSAPDQLLTAHYCSLFLGGHGARTHGVCQHRTLNGILKNQSKTIVYRRLSMPCVILPQCRHYRCCPSLCNNAGSADAAM